MSRSNSMGPMTRRLALGLMLACVAAVVAPALASAEEPQWYKNAQKIGATKTPVNVWNEIKLNNGVGPEGEIHCLNVIGASVHNEGGVGVGEFEGWGTNDCFAPKLEEALWDANRSVLEKEGFTKVTVFATAELPLELKTRIATVCTVETEKPSQCPNESEREPAEVITHDARRVSSFPWKEKLVRTTRESSEIIADRIGIGAENKTCYPTEKVKLENGEETERPSPWEKVPTGCLKINVVAPQIPAELEYYGSLEPALRNGAGNALSPSRLEFGAPAGLLVSNETLAKQTEVLGEFKFFGANGQELILGK